MVRKLYSLMMKIHWLRFSRLVCERKIYQNWYKWKTDFMCIYVSSLYIYTHIIWYIFIFGTKLIQIKDWLCVCVSSLYTHTHIYYIIYIYIWDSITLFSQDLFWTLNPPISASELLWLQWVEPHPLNITISNKEIIYLSKSLPIKKLSGLEAQ